jgi:CheY-like chemotaxis protein
MNAHEPAASAPKVRVLVADDEEVIATTLATILDLAGYEVCAVYGGEAALKLLDLFKPDLVITDITMPGVTGMEVAFAARASLPRCRILLFSGHASLHALLRTNELEGLAFEIVTKPISPHDLLEMLRDTLSSDRPALLVPVDVDEGTVH